MRRRGLFNPKLSYSACGVGAIMDLRGRQSHELVKDGLQILKNLDHRGARGADPRTGDGAGILLQKPHAFFQAEMPALPAFDHYGVGQFFLPKAADTRRHIIKLIEQATEAEGLAITAWRDVPTVNDGLGKKALETEPHVMQAFFVCPHHQDARRLDVKLYVLRTRIENKVRQEGIHDPETELFYICSLDRCRIVYKGMLTSEQLAHYYPDLQNPQTQTGLVLVHSRFSTNTLGAWHLAHPYRTLIHNGEFNTLRGNVNWMRAREAILDHPMFEGEIDEIKPLLGADETSDSFAFDRVLDLLLLTGRSLPHAMRMLIPEAWNKNPDMASDRRAFYEYSACLMEPWDGPALVVATDGSSIGAVLDRNGLRPCRYAVTKDDRLILGSETGILDIPHSEIRHLGRLSPGELFLADWKARRLVPEDETFRKITAAKPYERWLEEHHMRLDDLVASNVSPAVTQATASQSVTALQRSFNYTDEGLRAMLIPMAEAGKDPLGAMGNDAPLAVLSHRNKPVFDYFLQQFAQVSNPPLDYIRESLVTSLESSIGRKRNLLAETPEHCEQLMLSSPILTDRQFTTLEGLNLESHASSLVRTTYRPGSEMRSALKRIQDDAEQAVRAGTDILILDDRTTGPGEVAVPSMLVTAAIHHHLIRCGTRTNTALIVSTGEAYQAHHICCLLGYGADAIFPWLAYRSLMELHGLGILTNDEAVIHANYRQALEQGILKVMSKAGIATLESYKGAQIFEAVGLDTELVESYFPGTTVHLPGFGLKEFERETEQNHALAFDLVSGGLTELEQGGDFYWRRDGELHQWNPQSIAWLQLAARTNDRESYRRFSSAANGSDGRVQKLRDLLDFEFSLDPVPISEVESSEAILKRFFTSSMSFGALSREAHETLAKAMNAVGGKCGSGEGGEQVERFHTNANCSTKQVASGRFGVTAQYLAAAEQIEIKMAQGSKPGEGGELPGAKVGPDIASVRFTIPGVGLISPPPHHDIYSIEDLAQLIHDLRSANPEAEIQVKLVSKANVGTIAAGVAKAGADALLISGCDGGTGASLKTSIKHAGTPWELGLTETQQALRENRLRSRVMLRVDGGLTTGRDVVMAALLGAEEFGFGTAALVTLGCIMLRKCHCNTCSVGVATQDPKLRDRFSGRAEHVINYLTMVAEEVREIMATLGYRTFPEMVGQIHRLRRRDISHPKGVDLDLSAILNSGSDEDAPHKRQSQRATQADELDRLLIDKVSECVNESKPVRVASTISNRDRTVGALLSYELAKSAGSVLTSDDGVHVELTGAAGQSFGAFLVKGITLALVGDANDYVGKGLSGGRISVRVPSDASYVAGENMIIGNVALYGATSGEAYFNGVAGERFCVRNSGAYAVAEGVGDHGCEYMTGGVAVIIGRIGRNFGAGMSGGEAYLLDENGIAPSHINPELVTIEALQGEADIQLVKRLLMNHVAYTASEKARRLLREWPRSSEKFIKVIPTAYAEAIRKEQEKGADIAIQPPPAADEEVAIASTEEA